MHVVNPVCCDIDVHSAVLILPLSLCPARTPLPCVCRWRVIGAGVNPDFLNLARQGGCGCHRHHQRYAQRYNRSPACILLHNDFSLVRNFCFPLQYQPVEQSL
jgi:hypothetical protein